MLCDKQETELEVAETKTLRFSLGMTRVDKIRNEPIRATNHGRRFGDICREAE